MKRSFIYLFILLLVGTAGTAFAQNGEIYGTVLDEGSAPFGGVRVEVRQGGLLKGGTVTEDDGTFSVKPLQPGSYDVQFSMQSYGTKRVNGVVVTSGAAQKLNPIKMSNDPNALKEVVVVQYRKKLVDKVDVTTAKEIERAPTRNINDLVSLNPGVYQNSRGGGLSIGGARADGTVYVLDGQIVNSTVGGITPAQGTVEQVQVFSSGVPANYGDATGGIVAITSKGVTNKLHGNVQAQHSIDGYNQNLLNASATGPLISRKLEGGVKEPILGFLAGVDFQYDADDAPTFTKNPVLKADKLKQLQDNPLTPINTTSGLILLPSSRFITKDDFNFNKQQKNNSTSTVRFNGKLDYAVNKNINITAGGAFQYQDAQGYSRTNSYFAPDAIPNQIATEARGYLRFRQSFGSSVSRQLNEFGKDTSKRPVISNAFYTVQVDYRVGNSKSEDKNFKRNLFDYAYVGKFTQSRVPVYAFGVDSISGRKGVVLQTLDGVNGITFQASDKNRTLSNYTRSVYDYFGNSARLTDYTQVQNLGGMMNGDFPLEALRVNNVNIANAGAGLTGYGYATNDQIGLHADASFDFKPRGSKTVHAIQFGLYYEQRSSSSYSAFINTQASGNNSLWNLMNQLVNRHIQGLDYSNPIFVHNGKQYTKAEVDAGSFFLPTDTIIYNRLNTGTQSNFDANLRQKLGAGKFDYIDMYSVDPSKLSLNMFSADEILNQGASFVSYQGYDYTGKKLTGQVNFNDFFTAKDAKGNYTRPLGAFHPNYIAGYLMDQFRFKDMNFNVGVRIERYDASTKVLKDPYSLYEMSTKATADGTRNVVNGGKHPDNIGSDYAVYVDNNQSSSPRIVGYRSGDKWYDAYGVQIADPAMLKNSETGTGGTDPAPYLTDAGRIKIDSSAFDPNKSFTDYKPQVNIMPRFQFDFPINGDKAMFYAHYDILVQRPKVGNYATPLDYMYLDRNTGNLVGNPDLKPEKTFDYELGFQQVLTKNSALKIYAFYKERKDMIQVRPYLYAWPRTYYTYGNRDFSTTKGFAFKYDYRKPQNAKVPIEMSLSYTLQFADGTGSDATSGNNGNGNQVSSSGLLQNFISSGLPNLRFVSALNYDSRHNINLNFNYSYDDNEGPSIGGRRPLQNFNANLILRARSGEPYTTYTNVIGNNIQGGVNGTRLPWHYGIDLRMDKRFALKTGKRNKTGIEGQTEQISRYSITAFAYVNNIFNIREILGVYPYTSRPDDDGYITSPTGQQFLNSQQGPMQSAFDMYSLYVNNPYNLAGPRRIQVGASFSF